MRLSLDLPPGIFGDDTTFAAAGRWSDGSNVRFWRERPQVIGGWEKLTSTALTGICRTVFNWTDEEGDLHVAFGTHSALMAHAAGELFDITPAGLAEGAVDGGGEAGFGTGTYGTGDYGEPQTTNAKLRTWAMAAWGTNLLASPRGGTIYEWDLNTANDAVAVTNAPAECAHMLVSPTDQVFALGCNEEASGSFNPVCIRHSGIRANTEWTAGPATTAREYILPGGGRIVAGRTIGPYILVWTTHALFLGSYVGSPGQVWRFDRVGERCGLLGPNAACVVGQTAYWVGPDLQFRQYGLGGAVELVPCPIREGFADNLASQQGDKVVVSSNSQFGEVRVDYPDARDGVENSRYLAVSLLDGAWYRGMMDRTAFVDAGPAEFPIAVDASSYVYWHERGQSADGGVLTAYIETADQYLSEDLTGDVLGIWPDFADQVGAVSVTVTSRLKPQGDERAQTPAAMAPGEDKVDVRLNGRLFKLRFFSASAPSAWRLGRIAVEFVKRGRR